MLKLYPDLIYIITSYLDDKTLFNLLITSKHFNRYKSKEQLWLRRITTRYADIGIFSQYARNFGSYKDYYKDLNNWTKTSFSKKKYKYLIDVLQLLQDKRIDIIKLLTSRGGINIHCRIKDHNCYRTLLEYTCEHNVEELLDYLMLSVDPSFNNNSAIGIASSKGYINIVRKMLKWEGVDPRRNMNYAISYASRNGHIEVVKELLKWRGHLGEYVNPRMNNNCPYVLASINNHQNVLDILNEWEDAKQLDEDKIIYPSILIYRVSKE